MLTNKEKSLVIISYFLGEATRDIKENEHSDYAYNAAAMCSQKFLEEFGLKVPDHKEYNDFIKEFDEIAHILIKEMNDGTYRDL